VVGDFESDHHFECGSGDGDVVMVMVMVMVMMVLAIVMAIAEFIVSGGYFRDDD
jgi:hypothetical protein